MNTADLQKVGERIDKAIQDLDTEYRRRYVVLATKAMAKHQAADHIRETIDPAGPDEDLIRLQNDADDLECQAEIGWAIAKGYIERGLVLTDDDTADPPPVSQIGL